MGKFSRWLPFLKTQRELGYNMIHMTPMQKYGASFSHYSLGDHNQIDPYYFEDGEVLDKSQQLARLRETVLESKQETGLLMMCDIVLNHCNNKSEWLAENPDVAYTLTNSPWLTAAYVLDRAIL